MYQPDETIRLEVRVESETVWLTQQQMAELFKATKQNVSLHIKNIYDEGELEEISTVKDYLTVRKEGKRTVTKDRLLRPLLPATCRRHLLRRPDLRCLRPYRQSHQTGQDIHRPHRQLYRHRYPHDAQQS